jgi:YVTN family beta-propeller protein
MRKEIFTIIVSLLVSSCIKDPNPVIEDLNESYLSDKGVFILNEGNFRSGNGSLSFFSYDSLKIFNHVFLDINQRPLGDIPYSMSIHGSRAYIIVNNSGKIEVVNSNDMISVATINGILSPRYISFIDDTKAYVTSLYSDSLAILDLLSNSISGYINLKKSSESMIIVHDKAYVANWTGGNKIMIIDSGNDQVTDSIEVGAEPESMVIDKNETLWVLCNGGWKREYFAELIGIDTWTKSIKRRFVFPSITDSPTCLQIDREGEIMFFILNGIRRMNINDVQLPAEDFIPNIDHSFYKMGINPDNDEVFVTDAVDYVQKGRVLRYSREGALISEMQADIIPGGMCFKVKAAIITE